MKVKIVHIFRDKFTHEVYEVGTEREFDTNRAQNLISLGLVEPIEKAKPAKVEPKVEEPVAPAEQPAPEEEKVEVAETKEPETAEPAPAEAKVKVSRRQHRKSNK